MNYQIKVLLISLAALLQSCGPDEAEVARALHQVGKRAGPIYVLGRTPRESELFTSAPDERGEEFEHHSLGKLSSDLELSYVQFARDASPEYISAYFDEQRQDGALVFAEASTTYELFASESNASAREENPRVFNLLAGLYSNHEPPWWFRQVKAPAVVNTLASKEQRLADDETLVTESPIIAIVDSGGDFTHPAIAARVWENPSPGKAGCSNDRFGCDTTRGEGSLLGIGPALPFMTSTPGEPCPKGNSMRAHVLRSSCLHGTHVAGLIVGDAAKGVDGLCPTCKILQVKVVENLDGQGRVTDIAFLRALQYIRNLNQQLKNPIKIVNFSFGKFQWSMAVAHLVEQMRKEGVLFIAAAGNDNLSEKVFPAALSGVLAVTAVDHRGRKTPYANYGSWVDIAAPGGYMVRSELQGILSAAPGGEFFHSQGTSVASPIVAGVAGLLLSLEPELSGEDLEQRLLSSADQGLYQQAFALVDKPRYYRYDQKGNKVPLLGAGLLDANAALKAVRQRVQTLANNKKKKQISCGTLGNIDKGSTQGTLPLPLVFLLLPLMIVVSLRKKRTRKTNSLVQ